MDRLKVLVLVFAALCGFSSQAQLPTPLSQAQIDGLTDQKLKNYHQWLLDYSTQHPAQPDKTHGRVNQDDFPNLPSTAADCAVGRHWELVPTARCVCDGDTTHKPVSNDQPAACVGVPPVITTGNETQVLACVAPLVGTGTTQTRVVTYSNGVATSFGAWTTTSNDCNPVAAPPPVAPPACSPTNVTACEGVNSVTRDSCSGSVITVDWGACSAAPPASVPVVTFGSENQVLACPPGFTGNVFQSRTVTYSNSVPSAYGAWNETSRSCVPLPPVTPPPVNGSPQTAGNAGCPPGTINNGSYCATVQGMTCPLTGQTTYYIMNNQGQPYFLGSPAPTCP